MPAKLIYGIHPFEIVSQQELILPVNSAGADYSVSSRPHVFPAKANNAAHAASE
jgi:hypothetical protein